ncbi:iron(III) transport system substrate-binding protein [Clostridium tetanomorphum]|uniref:ABC transporter substrate-binding protein n=1 Tax=Clostridium tetanomorphum TaxID=1553 RepID=A0A923EBB9_CLOTT|nr:ABC transporter substrate-binding protein [Clostridium tetanomorphum]KAJ48908.1 iron(III)-binding periplasmic protein precursor [Clostridium tetanomorphum DSM 665]KAJ52165.1 iron(III)-binding periplasmic protein precursor [Clostridium tetanomorphum DSM 665]MBC2399915.1 ABC transporter substrate-binding protein [Clostridium tetanomorphum]MBP1866438.1 iron(III) transport system substrate-binding protein [Clostridium tetanomorphum]NRS86760.1 iron(III) transport system substrate-binding protein
MLKFKNILGIVLASTISITMLAGCGAKKEEEKNKDQKLTIYCGLMEDYMVAAVKQFEKQTGIKVDAVRMSSGEIMGRIKAEKENPKASVWFGGPADGFIQAKKDGLLEKYESSNAKDIPEQFKDKEGYWTGIYKGYLGFVSNKKLLAEKGAQAPQSWDDLLKSEFKGQVVTANPGSSGTAYTLLASVVQIMGEQKGLDYMKKLNGQVKSYQKSGTAPGRMVGQGEAMVGITFLHDAIKYREEGMKDIVLSTPKEGTGYEIGAVAILKGAPDAEAAKKFVDWCLTKEAQELGQTVGSYQFLTNPQAQPPKQADELKDTKLINYDFEWAGSHKSELIEKWNNAIK